MAVTDSSVTAPRRARLTSAVLIGSVGIVLVRAAVGVHRIGRHRRGVGQPSGASGGRSIRSVRVRRANRVSIVHRRNVACLAGRYRSSVNELLLSINHNLLAGLEVGGVGKYGVGADGEVDLHGNNVRVERLTRLSVPAAMAATGSLLFVFVRLLSRARGFSAAGGGAG